MNKVKQLAIFLENQPDALLRLSRDLSAKGINIEALSITDSVDHSVIRLIVNKPDEAKQMLTETGVMTVESEVIQFVLENSPGVLRDLCQKLAQENINIEYAYGSTSDKSKKCNIYFRVSDVEKAMSVITNSGGK